MDEKKQDKPRSFNPFKKEPPKPPALPKKKGRMVLLPEELAESLGCERSLTMVELRKAMKLSIARGKEGDPGGFIAAYGAARAFMTGEGLQFTPKEIAAAEK